MKDFCIYQHAQLPITRVAGGKVPSEWLLRYKLEIDCDPDPVIAVIDEAMGSATRGGGMYASKADAVIEKLQEILANAPTPEPEKANPWRVPARILGFTLLAIWIAIRLVMLPIGLVLIIVSGHAIHTAISLVIIDWTCKPVRPIRWLLTV